MVRLHPRQESVWETVDFKEIAPTSTYSDEDAERLNILRLCSHDVSGTYVFDMTSPNYRCAPALRFARRQLVKEVAKDGWNIFVLESWQVTKLRNSDNKKHRIEVHYRARPAKASFETSSAPLDPSTSAPTPSLPQESQPQPQEPTKSKPKRLDPPYLSLVDALDTDPAPIPTSPMIKTTTLTPPHTPPRSRSRASCHKSQSRSRSGSESSGTSSSTSSSPSQTQNQNQTHSRTSSQSQQPHSPSRRRFLNLSGISLNVPFKKHSSSNLSSDSNSNMGDSGSDGEGGTTTATLVASPTTLSPPLSPRSPSVPVPSSHQSSKRTSWFLNQLKV